MLETFRQVCDAGGELLCVSHALFDGDASFITAVELRFERMTLAIRAVADDDTVSCSPGAVVPDLEEIVVDASGLPPWSECIGSGVIWIWQMTNQQGYLDAVRLEFNVRDRPAKCVVELVVAASAIRVFTASEVGM